MSGTGSDADLNALARQDLSDVDWSPEEISVLEGCADCLKLAFGAAWLAMASMTAVELTRGAGMTPAEALAWAPLFFHAAANPSGSPFSAEMVEAQGGPAAAVRRFTAAAGDHPELAQAGIAAGLSSSDLARYLAAAGGDPVIAGDAVAAALTVAELAVGLADGSITRASLAVLAGLNR